MQYRLRTLLILLAILPPMLAGAYSSLNGFIRMNAQDDALRNHQLLGDYYGPNSDDPRPFNWAKPEDVTGSQSR
jgi:hypothetical protein